MDVKGERFDHALDAAKHARGVEQDTDLTADDLQAADDRVQGDRQGRHRPRLPERPVRAARPRDQGRLRQLVRQARRWTTANNQKIAHDLGTAVNVVTMVFGNMGDDSGTGVAFTRDPNTGEKTLFGEYLTNAQGEDVVAGIRTAPKISQMQTDMPEVYDEFLRIGDAAREALPRRPGPRVHDRARQALHAPDAERQADRGGGREDRRRTSSNEGVISQGRGARPDRAGARRPAPARPVRPGGARRRRPRIAKGLNASPGAAVGRAVFDADTAVDWVGQGERVVLVRIETSPDDFHGMAVAQGILTARGGATSHAAVVARQIGKPCVAGCHELVIDYGADTATANGVTVRRGRLDQRRRLDRRGLRRRAADGLGAVRGPARAPDDPRLGRRGPPDGGLDQRRQARGGRDGAPLRRPGHRPVPDRAHVPRRGAARDRAWRDPRRQRRDAGQGQDRGRRHADATTRPRRSRSSTRRWASSRSSSRATSRASSGRWTACRSSSA